MSVKKVLIFVLTICIVFLTLSFSSNNKALASNTGVSENNSEQTVNYGLESRVIEIGKGFRKFWNDLFIGSSATTTTVSYVLPNGTTAGNAGGVLGSAVAHGTDFVSGLVSFVTGSSGSASYQALQNLKTSEGGTPLLDYALYGFTLTELGLYETGKEDGFLIFRPVMGAILYVAYLMTSLVTSLFIVCIDFLQFFNPFAWIAGVDPWLGGAAVGWIPSVKGTMFEPIAEFAGPVLQTLQNLGLLLVPIMIGVIITSVFLFRKTHGVGNKIFRVVIRLAVVLAAIPIIGGLYTGFLVAMSESVTNIDVGASRVIAKTLVDFEAWGMNQRLSSPEAKIRHNGKIPREGYTDNSLAVSLLSLKINEQNYPLLKDGYQVANPWNTAEPVATKEYKPDSEELRDQINAMIIRYMRGDKFMSSNYDLFVRVDLDLLSKDNEDFKKDVSGWFELKDDDFVSIEKAPTIWTGSDLSIFNNGDLIMGGAGTYASNGSSNSSARVNETIGLSTMAMYNFLNSSFSESGVIVYSPTNVPSLFSRQYAFSVNAVGTGLTRYLNVIASVMQLVVILIIGLFYCLGMFFNNLKRGFSVLFNAPLVFLGSFQGLAKVLGAVMLMIVEILGTMFMYSVVVELIIIFDAVVQEMFNNMGGGGSLTRMWLMMLPLLNIIMYIFLIKLALKFRKQFIKTVDEIVMSVVDKFVMGLSQGSMQPAMAGGPSPGGAGLGGALAGAAGAAGLMNYAKKRGAKSGGGDDSGEAGVRDVGGDDDSDGGAGAIDGSPAGDVMKNISNITGKGGNSENNSGFDHDDADGGNNEAMNTMMGNINDMFGSGQGSGELSEAAGETAGNTDEAAGLNKPSGNASGGTIDGASSVRKQEEIDEVAKQKKKEAVAKHAAGAVVHTGAAVAKAYAGDMQGAGNSAMNAAQSARQAGRANSADSKQQYREQATQEVNAGKKNTDSSADAIGRGIKDGAKESVKTEAKGVAGGAAGVPDGGGGIDGAV